MRILLGFLPFIAFALVDHLYGAAAGLLAGAAVAVAMLASDVLLFKRSAKLLDIGAILLFGGLTLYASLAAPTWGVDGVRLLVDGGLLLIAVVSLVIRRPFTEQFAREEVAAEYWDTPSFKRTNVILTSVWVLAFAVIVCSEVFRVSQNAALKDLSAWMNVAALVGAIWFTRWYPAQVRGRRQPEN